MLQRPLLVRRLWWGPFQVTEARGLPHTLHRRVTLSPLSHVTSASGTRNSGGTGDDGRVKGHTPLIASANGSNTREPMLVTLKEVRFNSCYFSGIWGLVLSCHICYENMEFGLD